jgi:cytochrome P450
MLDSFIRNKGTQKEAQVEVVTQIIAGSDTTATPIRMNLLYMISNPHVLAKLRAEIDGYL